MAASGASLTSPTICKGEQQFNIFCYDDLVKRAHPDEYIASTTFYCADYDWAIFYYSADNSIPEKDQERGSMALKLLSHDIPVESKGTYTLHINGDNNKGERFDIHVAPESTNCWR
jgi:hypothetical protein